MVELNPETDIAPPDLLKIFRRPAPVQVDLGCGDGSFLLQMAQLYPEKNFLGIERMAHRVAKARRKANQLDNMRVLRLETSYAIEFLLPERSIEAFYLLFPDPWPKRRHHRRRIVSAHFLESIHRALERNGLFHIATDHADYFREIQRALCPVTTLQSGVCRFDVLDPVDLTLPQTKFEQKFCAAGAAIYRLSLRKISPVT